MKRKLTSQLEKIATEVFSTPTLTEAKNIIITFLETHPKIAQKELMMKQLQTIPTKQALDKFICNSLLRFEGLSTNSYAAK
jgi:hypothetical protein